MKPFLQIVTWTYRRPTLLAKQQASLAMQTCQEFRQDVTVDDRGVGFAGVHRALQQTDADLAYIWIFDDDDIITDESFVAKVKEATKSKPDVIYVYSQWKPETVHPDFPVQFGHISNINYIVSKRIWMKYRSEYRAESGGDGYFILAVIAGEPDLKTVTVDGVMTATQVISRGRPEEQALRLPKLGEKVIIKEGCGSRDFMFETGSEWEFTEKTYEILSDLLRCGRAEYKDRPFRTSEEAK
jgi:hypothetical protein